MKRSFFIPGSFLLSFCLTAAETEAELDGVAFFDQHIHPVLEQSCFPCHGLETVEGGLVLTNREGLMKGGTRGPGIDVGNLPESVLLKMIRHEDLKQRMPFQQPPLGAEEQAAFEKWVLMGAPYNPAREMASKVEVKHGAMVIDDKARSYWAYQAPRKPGVSVQAGQNPIDVLLAGPLNAKGIQPNERAAPRQLLRRVTYDLTGLAPGLDALEAFEQGPQDAARWSNLVDELLASPRFGERMAVLWLDLVRYAETNGFERDSEKPFIWRYRDYVIKAFNENKPYDRFILEQLAGDELEPKTMDAHVATGYLALMQRDDEPADPQQVHSDLVAEMVDVTGEAFLGTTMGCAKCHDHKGDPIRQADYYSLMAFFDPIKADKLKQPNRYWKDPAHQAELRKTLQAKEEEMKQLWTTVDVSALDPFIQKPKTQAPALIPLSKEGGRQPWEHSYAEPKDPNWNLPSHVEGSFKPVILPMRRGPANGQFTGQAEAWQPGKPRLYLRKDFALTAIPERLIVYSIANSQSLTVFVNGEQVFKGKPHQVGHYQFYPFSAADLGALTTGKNTLALVVENKKEQQKFIDLGLFTDPITSMAPHHYGALFPERIRVLYGDAFMNRFLPLSKQFGEASARVADPGIPYMAQNEAPDVTEARIHIRGNVHAQGEAVPMAVPAVMVESEEAARIPVTGDFKKNGSHGRRLALAQWIASEENPLTARVMVNRLWQHCFGIGIVPSANDFGTLGENPSNTELLDWLAIEFMASGWDVKHMLRLMLTSETYQRSTAPNESGLAVDPTNQLHWRHSPRRLSAEEIRDTFLMMTKELRLEKPTLPFVRPPMPEAVLATASKPESIWPATAGIEANSRSIYVHVKRSIKLPMLSAFDAPERDMSCAHRFATTVPTQALTMLNSRFVNDRASKLAERIRDQHPGDVDAQLGHGFALATGRSAQQDEQGELKTLYQDLIDRFTLEPQQALERICLLVLNLNETIYLD